jgi:hypothetical protein
VKLGPRGYTERDRLGWELKGVSGMVTG